MDKTELGRVDRTESSGRTKARTERNQYALQGQSRMRCIGRYQYGYRASTPRVNVAAKRAWNENVSGQSVSRRCGVIS